MLVRSPNLEPRALTIIQLDRISQKLVLTMGRESRAITYKAHGGGAMIDNRTQVFDVAMKNARTIEACLDRLAMMGAHRELKMIAGRLSRLTFRAAPFSREGDECTARE